MAEIEKTEFEFPDEVEVNARKGGKVVEPESDEPEIEVVDDTPPEDRGRKPMTEPPKEVTDDELSKYDESVQKRIKHFTKGYHDERRAKADGKKQHQHPQPGAGWGDLRVGVEQVHLLERLVVDGAGVRIAALVQICSDQLVAAEHDGDAGELGAVLDGLLPVLDGSIERSPGRR